VAGTLLLHVVGEYAEQQQHKRNRQCNIRGDAIDRAEKKKAILVVVLRDVALDGPVETIRFNNLLSLIP
jgi:hypothetical protein